MKLTVVVVGALLLGIGAVAAQQDQVKATQAMMKGNGKNAGALAAMVKGEKPYDQAAVDEAMAQFEDTIKKFPTLFPDSIKGMKPEGDYSASPKVWEDKAGFKEHIHDRQAMRRLPRNLPDQGQLGSTRPQAERGRTPGCPPSIFYPSRVDFTSSPGRGFRRPDWPRCGR